MECVPTGVLIWRKILYKGKIFAPPFYFLLLRLCLSEFKRKRRRLQVVWMGENNKGEYNHVYSNAHYLSRQLNTEILKIIAVGPPK